MNGLYFSVICEEISYFGGKVIHFEANAETEGDVFLILSKNIHK